ncbi:MULTISPECIES: thioredoxin [Salimicrobium]|uniref:Thioredoxin n=1 Tax=Salimicrobium humidisoli TaxID=2029857 RepID=A0ABX4HSY2_9BACI|nr:MULTISPECIES: thioredoxin [Salimicrobium]PBB06334.1 thioredoxin [Salimicrobium humidisoli]
MARRRDSMAVKDVTDSTFTEETKDGLVVAEFGAPWCGPCKMIAPVLEEIDEEDNQISVVQLNVDENPETAQKHSVMSIPTLLFLKDGEVVDQAVGFQPKEEIMATAQKHV